MNLDPNRTIPEEQHPELYERMCKARNFIEQVLEAYVKARKDNGMTRPKMCRGDMENVQGIISSHVKDDLAITDLECREELGEGYELTDKELEKLLKENWK